MTSEEKKNFFQYLFSIAWVDGSIEEEEAEILRNIVRATEMDPEAKQKVRSWFSTPPDEPDWSTPREDLQLRDTLMRNVVLMAGADLVFNMEEMAYLERLRSQLGMSEAEFHEILQQMEQRLAEASNVE